MKKVLFAVMIMMMFFGCMGQQQAGGFTQMVGQMSQDSPTDFNVGINKVNFLSEGSKVVGDLYLPQNYKKGQKS